MDGLNANPGGPVIVDDPDATVDAVTPGLVDINQGLPQPASDVAPGTIPAGEPDTAPDAVVVPQTPVEGTEGTPDPATAPDPAVNRLEQEMAQKNKLLMSLGIDPLSDIGKQLEDGVITPEQVRNHAMAQYGPQTPVTQPQVVPESSLSKAEIVLAAATEKYNAEVKEGAMSIQTNSDLNDARDAVHKAELAEIRSQITAGQQATQVNESVGAVLSIARQNPEYANMEASVQATLDKTSIALTGQLADEAARAMGLDPSNLTTAQYQYFATQAQQQLQGLANHYRNLGRAEAKPGFNPTAPLNPAVPGVNVNLNPVTPTPVPIGNAGMPQVVANPYARVNSTNHKAAARQFVADSGVQ